MLLIGIDAYERSPLHGCVADVTAIEQLLIERLGVRPEEEEIVRLLAPHEGRSQDSFPPSGRPTLAAIHEALRRLGSDEVASGDPVLIYYSGHAARLSAPGPEGAVFREALAPLDYRTPSGAPQFLFDYEFNRLLARIAARTSDLTVILDCCHSGGAARADDKARVREVRWNEEWPPGYLQKFFPDTAARGTEAAPGLIQPVGHQWLVAAACHPGEFSWESPDDTGQARGAFSVALAESLRAWTGDLDNVRWSDLWPLLLGRVERRHPQQHPQVMGDPERLVFGGRARPRDRGIWVRRVGDRYRVDGGEITGLTPGAVLHLYGSKTEHFPPPGSNADRAERCGTLRITEAEHAVSWGRLEADGGEDAAARAQLVAEPALRGRLIQPGEDARLVVGIEPWDERLKTHLESSHQAVVRRMGEPGIELRVYREGCDFVLRDDLYDLDPAAPASGQGQERGPGRGPDRGLGRYGLLPEFARTASLEALLQMVEHYGLYVRPLRRARRLSHLAPFLKVTLLRVPWPHTLKEAELQDPQLPPLPPGPGADHAIAEGHGFCVWLKNLWEKPLYVTALNCTAGGSVEYLGDGRVDGKAVHVFWCEGELGVPFLAYSGRGAVSIDRLVVLGTSRPDVNLRSLELKGSFETYLGIKDTRGPAAFERWTATVTTLRLERGAETPGGTEPLAPLDPIAAGGRA